MKPNKILRMRSPVFGVIAIGAAIFLTISQDLLEASPIAFPGSQYTESFDAALGVE
ncbi:MAG: putative membrane protein [Kiritimatiellia bacterium]|jgi:uncharacterized membrane protein